MIDRGGGKSSKKTDRRVIAKKAKDQYTSASKSGGDSRIVKSIKSLFNPTQQNNGGPNKSPVKSAGSSLYQKVVQFDKDHFGDVKSPTPFKERMQTTPKVQSRGQFSGVAKQAQELYEQQTTYDLNNIDDWNRLGRSRAKGDLTTSAGLQGVYYTNNLDDDTHTRLIGQGENWLHGSTVEDWLDLGNINTEEDLANATAKYEDYERYLRRYTASKRVYNSEVGEFESHQVIMADAPLPSWIPATSENIKEWEYYKGYQNEVGNELRDQADDLLKEREKYKKRQYKSAFNQDKTANLQPYPTAEEEQAPIIDSFADVVYTSLGGANFFDTYKDYVKEYHVNPLLAGKFTTVIGNHLWNLMDTLDFASRGVRAAVAGGNNLGGTQHTFEGQEDFWATISTDLNDDQNRYYQQLFVDNGGYDLLLRAKGEKIGRLNKLTDDEIKAQLEEKFSGAKVSWEDVYNAINEQYFGEDNRTLLTRTLENVKEAYTNPEAEFNADTGNMFGNMVLETILDPGMIVGGVAKSGARTTAGKMTDIALHGTDDLEGVLKQVSNLSEPELKQAMQSKPIKKALSTLTKSNESRNIIFKDADKLRGDIKGFSAVLKKEGILSPEVEEEFVEGMLNAFTGRQTSVNGKVIGSQLFNEIKQERKAAKLYGTVDKAIDTIDMAVIKGSFIEPFVVSKMYKSGKKISSNLFRSVLAARKLESDQAAQATAKAFKEGGLDVGLKTVSNRAAKNIEKDQKFAEQVEAVKNQFKTAASRIEDVNSRLYDQTPEEAMTEVSKILEDLTGRKGHTLTDIDSIISDVRKNYALGNDMDDVFDSLKRSTNAFTDALEKQDFRYKKDFLNEIRNIDSSDELASVINNYSDKIDIHGMRTIIYDALPNKSFVISGELDNILDQLDNGLLTERTATSGLVQAAGKAMGNVSTAVKDSSRDPSIVLHMLHYNCPTIHKALNNLENYPMLRKLSEFEELLHAADIHENTLSLDLINGRLAEIHKDIAVSAAELSSMGRRDFVETELKQISDELCDLKASLDHGIVLHQSDIVTTFHLDKQAKYDTIINDHRFTRIFSDIYNSAFKPAIDMLTIKAVQGNDAFNNSTLYKSLMKVADMKYSYQRYRRFVAELSNLNISDEAKYAIRNGLFGNYGESGRTLIEATRRPGKVRRWLNEMLYNEFSASKVGMDTLSAKLASIDSFNPDPIIADYVDEIKSNPTLDSWYKSIIDGDPADPNTYLQKQVLSTILTDSDAILKFNKYDKAPVFVHVSTSGLTDDAAITGISYYKWRNIPVDENGKPTMEAIYNALNNNSVTYNRVMSDAEIKTLDDNTLYSIYKNSIGERSQSPDELRELYKSTFGVTEERQTLTSESDILEKFFDDMYGDTIVENKGLLGNVKSVETSVPTFVVHDLDGFNIPFINRRSSELANNLTPRMMDYNTRLANRVENVSINTFEQLRSIVNDSMLSDEEFKEVEQYINTFAEDLSTNTSKEFNMLDIQRMHFDMMNIIDEVDKLPASPEEDEIITILRESIGSAKIGNAFQQAEIARTELGLLDDEAKQIYTVTDSHIKPNTLNGADTPEVRAYYDDNMRQALNNLSNRLGIDLVFEDRPSAAWAGQHRHSYVSTAPRQIAINTSVIHDMKITLIHELRHDLSLTNRFGDSFKNILLKRAGYGSPNMSSEFKNILDFKLNQYRAYYPDFTVDAAVEELNAELFASYFNDADMLRSVQDYMAAKGMLDTPEGRSAYASISDLLNIIQGDFQLERCHIAADADFDGTRWIRDVIIDNGFINDKQMKEELIGSLINVASDRDRLTRMMLEAFSSHNPVKDAATRTGERIINASDRLDAHRIIKYFATGRDNIIDARFTDLHKMADISRWIDEKLRYSIRSGAEDYLAPMKNDFDNMILAVKNLAENSKGRDGYFKYLKSLRVPNTATESYLLCQKLYDDFLKYWLNADYSKNIQSYLSTQRNLSRNITEETVRTYMLAEFVDNMHFGNIAPRENSEAFTDMLRLFEGEGHSLIFKDVGVEYISKDDIFTTHGKLKEGIDLAHKLKKGYTQIKGIFTESNYLDSVLRASGIETRADFELGLMYRHTADFIDYLEDNKLIQNERFISFIKDISDLHVARVHNVRMNRLKVDGKINADKLFAELVYNNANHIAFQKVYYTKKDLSELKKLIKQINSDGSDYLKLVEDRGTISVYLTNKCEVIRGTGDNGREIRYIHKLSDNTYGARYFKPELENISLPTVDELKKLVDKNDLIEFKDAYNMLRECWDDVSLLSDGASNGTLGRVVTARDQEEYYKIANSLMPDLLSSSGLRKSGMYGNIIYDPGFMLQGDYDIFTEFLHTMESQAENFKATGGFVNQVFGSGKEMSLNELAEFVSDADLVDYFNDNSDFVLCTLVPSKDTKLGVKVQQMRLNTASDVATARQMNTVVLPYDMFIEMSDSINIKQYPSDLNRAITKMMIVYKAGALFHPGTWVRNFIDATQKSATDLGQSPLNIFSTVHYEMEAIRDICKYQKALRFGDDFLSEANWSTVQRMIGTDMSYEDFNLLRGMMDSGQYVSKADNLRRINNIRNGGREVISGDDIGLRNLSERDISSAYKLAEKDSQLPMPHKRFIELYTGTSEVLDDVERNTYEQTMQLISNSLHDRKAILSLDNAVRASFVPFNIGEITVRFAQMRKLNELGFSHNQALKRVHMTQFRRADRLSMTNKLEYIIPFITFKYNNLKYWMRMMDENPAYFKYFQKLYGNIAEDTIEQQEQKGRQLDYESSWMLKTGGIPIGNGKYYFKINPSFFDAVETMYGFPTDLVERQNPLLRLATRASMYELGLDSKYIFQELDLRPSDANLDTQDILKAIAPRISKLTELDKITTDGLRTWADGLGPNMDTLYKLLPSLIGRNYDYYADSDFDAYQESLAKDGLWYDSNLGEIVPLSQKNESGMNNPAISWMDRQNFMMEHFNKVWDANRGQFVDFWARTEGGLNQYFDFVNDPDAWDKLCAEYERKGMKFDYNTRHFIPNSEWTPSGLNNPNLSFEDRVKLMKEKFGFEWDANQNCFINPEKGNHYIAGGLNNAKSFREVQLYRYALFGEIYNKDTKHFEKTEDSKVVVIDSLFKSPEYNNYFAMLGIPRLADLKQRIHLNDEGLLVTSDGKYVLMNNNDYNQRVFNKIVGEYGGRFYNGWKNYSQRKTSYRNKKPYKGQTLAKHYYTGFGWNDVEGYYRLSYEYSYQYHNPQPSSKLNRLISPPVTYPYGGGYNKFSFHNRY